ncbi:MAG: tryptophanase [candidate division WOR-3 bacterium]|nr:tryptophanase [candidate division WOR-3 bacterium]
MWEPYRIKVVEPLPRTTRKTRKKVLEKAGFNPFLIPAKYVTIDLISDSGTGAMTAEQWARMIEAREDFAGQTSFEQFLDAAKSLTGFPYIQPVHQGRSAERILFGLLLNRGDTVLANTHFETTRSNIESLKCHAIDLPSRERPFRGNIDLTEMQKSMGQRKKVKIVILTVTSNILGGQPVSMENIAAAKKIARHHGIAVVLDASRYADNAFLIKQHGEAYGSINAICRKMFGYADIAYLSSKKDGLVNIGGFIGLRDGRLYDRLKYEIIRQEAFPTSGGLAARDLAAMTGGLVDSTDEHFLRVHIENIKFLGRLLKENRVDIFEPVGGHAVVIMKKKNQTHFAFALAAQIYIDSGIRVGVFDDCVRVAVPRRVYTREHLRYVGECIATAYSSGVPRLKLVHRPSEFFNFFARYVTV